MYVIDSDSVVSRFGDSYSFVVTDDAKAPRSFVEHGIIYSNIQANRDLAMKLPSLYPEVLNAESALITYSEDWLTNKLVELDTRHSYVHFLSAQKRGIPLSSLLFYTSQLREGRSFLPLAVIDMEAQSSSFFSLAAKIVKSSLSGKVITNLDDLRNCGYEIEKKYFRQPF